MQKIKFTVLGSKGFIGSNLVQKLTDDGIVCHTPTNELEIEKENLGHVIYSIGLTADFRERPFDTVDAHVNVLQKFLKTAKFDSFLYLSSTRIYSKKTQEDSSLTVNPSNFSDLYNISKILGEALCLSLDNPNVRIVRLSNVVGNNFTSSDFLISLIRDALQKKSITLHTSLQSEKDYITIDDVVKLLPRIALHGKRRIYNVASGINIKTETLVNEILRLTNCTIYIDRNATTYSFQPINIYKIVNEFDYQPSNVIDKIGEIINNFKDAIV